jgi:hypothetical protein
MLLTVRRGQPGLYCFEPSGLDWETTDGMHPLDGLGFLGGAARLPGTCGRLDEGDSVPAPCVTHTNEDGLVLAGDEDIVFFEDGHAVVSENGHHAVVGSLTYAHE